MKRIILSTALLACLSSNAHAQMMDMRANIIDTLRLPVRYDSAGGYRIAYYEAGVEQGPVVILIPTLRWSAHSWAQTLPAIARSHRVIAIDPLGTGYSDKPRIDYKMNTWTDGFAEFLRRKGIGKAVFVGTEMGGALAVQMALDYPQHVHAVVVAASNSGPGPHEGGARRTGGLTPEATRAGLMLEFFDSALITDAIVQTLLQRRLAAGDRHTIQSHLADHRPPYTAEELARINVPALFVWCREDRITPPSWGRDFAHPLRNAEFRLLERCGHYPNLERPAHFNQAVLEFLLRLHKR